MAIDPLVTIGTLRDQHLALMREWHNLPDPARRERAASMRRAAVAAGRNIGAPLERDEAQGIVDYWASAIAGLPGEGYPELLSIDPYSGAQAIDAGRSVREAYEALQPQEAQRMARSILLDLLTLGSNGVERDLPRSRQALQKSAGTTDTNMFDAALATLVKSGAVVRRASESRADDYFEAVDGRIVESWPALAEWLQAAKAYGVERAQMMERAQRWSDAGRRRDLLLNSGEVENALSFRGEDELLDAYIESSRSVRSRARQAAVAILVLAVAILSAALLYSIHLTNKANRESAEAKARLDVANALLEERNAQLRSANAFNAQAQANASASQQPDRLDPRDLQRIGPGTGDIPENTEATRALQQIPILTGYMWLGSNDTPQVSTLQGGAVTGLGQAAAQTRYRTRIPIYLRRGLPAAGTYAPAAQQAVIPARAQVVLLEAPVGYDRSNGRQYWARVRVVPQVYIQYDDATPAMVERLRRQFAAAGFEVPAGERRDFTGAEVRYFQTDDRPIAAFLQQMLNGPEFGARGDAQCRSFVSSSSTAPNFRLEIWYNPSHAGIDKEIEPCS